MQWTKEPPTQPGYYWLTNYRFAKHLDLKTTPVIVQVYISPFGGFGIIFQGADLPTNVGDLVDAEWAGPIELPE